MRKTRAFTRAIPEKIGLPETLTFQMQLVHTKWFKHLFATSMPFMKELWSGKCLICCWRKKQLLCQWTQKESTSRCLSARHDVTLDSSWKGMNAIEAKELARLLGSLAFPAKEISFFVSSLLTDGVKQDDCGKCSWMRVVSTSTVTKMMISCGIPMMNRTSNVEKRLPKAIGAAFFVQHRDLLPSLTMTQKTRTNWIRCQKQLAKQRCLVLFQTPLGTFVHNKREDTKIVTKNSALTTSLLGSKINFCPT